MSWYKVAAFDGGGDGMDELLIRGGHLIDGTAAPALPGRAGVLREYLASSAPWLPFGETSFADYVAAFPPTSVNVILQVGHHTLRIMTAGMEARPVTAGELASMERLLAEALAA